LEAILIELKQHFHKVGLVENTRPIFFYGKRVTFFYRNRFQPFVALLEHSSCLAALTYWQRGANQQY
jgi:hypothetical protein